MKKKNLPKIIDLLNSGSIISLISAGTPGISDPGAILVNECIKNDIQVIPIPGPSAVSTAVSISGFGAKYFLWFSEKLKDLKENLDTLSRLNYSIVFLFHQKNLIKHYLF